MTQEIIDRLLHRTQSNIFTTEPPITLFPGANRAPQDDLEKHQIFMPVSKAEKLRKPAPKASQKR